MHILWIQTLLHDEGTGWLILRLVIIFALTYGVGKLLGKAARRYAGKQGLHRRFLMNLLMVVTWMVGLIIAFDQIPRLQQGLTALLAGSGIAALAIGLAAQESLGNAINGVVISFSRPFEVGDRIRLVNGNITGYVEDITMRHTVIRTFMNSRIIIPNSTINKDMIENSTFWNVKASGFIDVTITYESDLDRAQELMAEIIGNHPDFVDTRAPDQQDAPKVRIFIRGLGLYGVELRASMWTESINNNFGACSDVRMQILKAFQQEGIGIAHSKLIDPLLQQKEE